MLRWRIKDNPTLAQVVWWALALGLVGGIVANNISGYDWFTFYYHRANHSVHQSIYNPLWLYLIVGPVALLPPKASFAVFTLLNTGLLWLGARLTGANRFLLLFSFPTFWVLWFGQIDALVMTGAALGLWATQQRQPILVGLAIPLLLIKPHIGGPLAILYIIWNFRWQTIATAAGIILLSLLIWGPMWPITWVTNLVTESARGATAAQNTNISLFPYGLAAWLTLAVPMPRVQRAITVLAATFLSLPYAPIYSLITLLVMPLPWWAYLLSSAPYLMGQNGYGIGIFVPLGAITWVLVPIIRRRYFHAA
jgi:hypothetical protein